MQKFLIVASLVVALFSCRDQQADDVRLSNSKADSLSAALNSPELKDINKKLLEDPSSASLYNQRAALYIKLKLPDEAIGDAKRAIRLDSNRAEHYLTLVDAYFTKNNTRQARELLEITAKKFPENVEALLKLAELYFIVRKYQEGIDYVNKALKIDDRNARAYYLKGSIYRESGDTTRAVSSLETAVEQDNRYKDAYYDLGVMFAARRNPVALQYYDNALRIDPGNVEIRYAKGKLLQDLGKTDEAMALYKEILGDGSSCPHCCYNLGALYLNVRNEKKTALEWFEKAIIADPEYAEAYFARGYTYAQLGQKDKARADYKHCLSLSPNFEPAIMGLNEL